jgi:putative membrane protein insertion efficiency factor
MQAIMRVDRVLAILAIVPIRCYARLVSPVLPRACRYVPTCSDYAVAALRKHGFVKGGRLALWRLAKCRPFGGSGWDPVP